MSYRSFLAAFCVAMSLGAANAQAPAKQGGDPPYDPSVEKVLRSRCNGDCFRQADRCRASIKEGKASAEQCDTRAVACFVACPKCVAGYKACRTNPAGAGSILSCTLGEMNCISDDRKAHENRADLIRFGGGDGKTAEAAVVIQGARNESEGIIAELYWAARALPGWRKTKQALVRRGGRVYDRILFVSPQSGRQDIYFDVTGFFGKM